MKLKNNITAALLVLSTFSTFAQNDLQKKADNLFNNFAFVQATSAYHNLINHNINTNYATRQLADSYAYLRNPDSAVVYYEKVVKQNHVPIEYYYNYAQALRGTKNYEASRTWLKQFKDAGGNIKEQHYLEDSDFLNAIFNATKQYVLKPVKFNSKFSDFGAYQHNNKIYFTSARDEGTLKKHLNAWDEEPFLNIYVTEKNANTVVNNKSKLKGKINSVYHDGPLTITKDGKTMYFSRTNFIKNFLGKNGEGISNLKIYKATLVDGKWSNIEDLPFNSNHFSNGHPALNEDETKLYFASDRSGGYGGSDIYYVNINNGSYSQPINAGTVINTNKNEKFPFVNSKGVLFFSSDGHPGLGLLDIYGTVSDKNKNIKSIINLGTPVNSSKDDFSFFMNQDGLSGFFASNRKGGIGSDDIYAYDRIPPLNIEGTVYNDSNNKAINNATITLVDSNNVITTTKTNENGHYIITINRDTAYQITVNKDGYNKNTKSVSSKNTSRDTRSISHDFLMQAKVVITEKPIETISLSPIYYNFNSASIRKEDKESLDYIVKSMLNTYPKMSIKIASYSDSRGPNNYNYLLSQKRASAAYNYLIKQGINPSRIINYKGFGEEKLLNNCNNSSNCTKAQHQINRRTEFIVVKMN
ncbi:OmpA family protein [Algibacter sp. PT7-4]|uniref:OmpA family protein n=1 Tax=Algibacter ulvanivorans TaxID=3400999 RepID=UPI003AABBC9E